MLERERLESKKISKTNAVTSIMEHELPADDVYIGPSDYVPWLTDRKWAHIRLEGQAFGDVPLIAEMKLEVWDSPNSAGIVTDAVRCCKLAHEPRHRRPDRRPELLPHEVAATRSARTTRRARRPRSSSPSTRTRARPPRRPASRPSRRPIPSRLRLRAQVTPPRRSRSSDALPGGPRARAAGALPWAQVPERFSIAQVTPYPWEDAHEVNAFVAELSARAGRARSSRARARPVALAGARARLAPADPLRARASRDAVRPRRRASACSAWASCCRSTAAASCRRRRSTSARTVEELLDSRAARLRPRARAVRAEHVVGRAAPLARAQRRLLPLARPSGCSRPRWRAASWSSSSAASTRARRPSTPRAS